MTRCLKRPHTAPEQGAAANTAFLNVSAVFIASSESLEVFLGVLLALQSERKRLGRSRGPRGGVGFFLPLAWPS